MKSEELKQDLEKLEKAVEYIDQADTESRERLTQLIESLHSVVNGSINEQERKNMRNQFQDSVVYFEVKHPAITDILNRTGSILAHLGI